MAIKHAFETVVNANERTAMALVYFLDELFKKEFRGASVGSKDDMEV